jgi:hypothetical protein
MRIRTLCSHLRHPLTHTDAKGKPHQFSSKEMACVTVVVLTSLALAIAEAIKSNRSLKSSCVSIGIVAGTAFYLAAAIIKMASRGDGFFPGSNGRKGLQPGQGKNGQGPNILEVSVTGSDVKSEWIYMDNPQGPQFVKEKKAPVTNSTKTSNPSVSQEPVNLIEVSGLMDKSMWVDVNHSPNERQRTQTTVTAQRQVTDSPRTSNPSVSQEPVNLIEVSGLMDKSMWVDVNHSPNEQQGPQTTIISEVKPQEQLTHNTQTSEPSKNLSVIRDEKWMEISVMGSNVKSEWFYMDGPLNDSGSEQQGTQSVKEEKQEQVTNTRKLSNGCPPIDLTKRVYGLDFNPGVAVDTSSNCSRSYHQLTVTDDQFEVISEMIQLIGNTLLFNLYFKKSQLLEMGKKVENVHPLKFLETLLNNPEIKKSMLDIKDSRFKWRGFLDGEGESLGFIAQCEREANLEVFEPYITDFCRAVNVNAEEVRSFCEAKKWEELINFLVQ